MTGFFTVLLRFAIFFFSVCPMTGLFAFFAFLLFTRFFETFFDFDADFAMEVLPGYGDGISWICWLLT